MLVTIKFKILLVLESVGMSSTPTRTRTQHKCVARPGVLEANGYHRRALGRLFDGAQVIGERAEEVGHTLLLACCGHGCGFG